VIRGLVYVCNLSFPLTNKNKDVKLVFTVSLLYFQHEGKIVKIQAASSLVMSLSKMRNRMPSIGNMQINRTESYLK